jgi:phage-related protein
LDVTGDGDSAGHTMILDVKGKGNDILVDQSGVYDNMVNLTTVGDNADIDITQSD